MASLQYHVFSGFISKLPIKLRLQLLYYRRFKKIINFESPITFTEKIQKIKIDNREPQLTIAADKIASKDFVHNIVPSLYIPKTLWAGESAGDLDSLDIGLLPDDYVFKANHTSQTLQIVRNGLHLSKEKMKNFAKSWLNHDQATVLGEWAYMNIPRKIFIEEFLDFEGGVPDDYKFFVYHGKVHFIQLDCGRFTKHTRNMFDRNWNDLGFNFSHKRSENKDTPPGFLSEMVEVAESIGAFFDFVRVDLYFYNNMVTFGELTMYPGAGFEKFPSDDWDIKFGIPLHS